MKRISNDEEEYEIKCSNFEKCHTLIANSVKGEFLVIYKFPPYFKLHIVKEKRKNYLRYHFCSKKCLVNFFSSSKN